MALPDMCALFFAAFAILELTLSGLKPELTDTVLISCFSSNELIF